MVEFLVVMAITVIDGTPLRRKAENEVANQEAGPSLEKPVRSASQRCAEKRMKKITKPLQLLQCIALAASMSACGTDILTCETSPDGQTDACAYTKRIGGNNTFVALTDKKTGNEIKIMKIKNVCPISFRWVESGQLYVEGIPNQNQVEYLKQDVMGVKVNIVPQKRAVER